MKNAAMVSRIEDQVEVLSLGQLADDLSAEIYERTNGVVQAGPFKGMQVYPDRAWPEANMAAELLGFFEQELQGEIEREIVRLARMDNPRITNMGCAEGYYAVGLARRLPNARVHAFDTSERAMQIVTKNAEVNNVGLTPCPVAEALGNSDLIVMDCEGGEYDYLDPQKYPGMANATIIVELHPNRKTERERNLSEGLYGLIAKRFEKTHSCRLVMEGGRDPNLSSLLWPHSSLERWLAVCESRPCLMNWLVLRPYPQAAHECGDCTMCCTMERVEALKKPKRTACQHCDKGCTIHETRPAACRNFNCLWRLDENMPEWMRPDRLGAYAFGAIENGHLNIVCGDHYTGQALVGYVTQQRGLHAVVERGLSIEFVPAKGQELPPALMINWGLK